METGYQSIEEGVGDSPHDEVLPVPLETEGGGGYGEVCQGEVGGGHHPLPPPLLPPLEADCGVMMLAGGEGGQGSPAQLVEADQDLGEDEAPLLHPGAGGGQRVAQLTVPVLLTHAHVASENKITLRKLTCLVVSSSINLIIFWWSPFPQRSQIKLSQLRAITMMVLREKVPYLMIFVMVLSSTLSALTILI